MWLVLFVTLAHWAGYELLRDRFGGSWRSAVVRPEGRRGWWWLFYLSLALGFLAKGPIAWVPLGTVAIFAFCRPVPDFARRFLFVRGILLTLALVALWGVPALVRTHGEFRCGRTGAACGRPLLRDDAGAWWGLRSGRARIAAILFSHHLRSALRRGRSKLPWFARRLWRKRDALDLYLIAGAGGHFRLFSRS